MKQRLSQNEEELLMSSIRTGTPLAPDLRREFVVNTQAVLAHAKSYLDTCHLLADLVLADMSAYEHTVAPEWRSGVVEELQWCWERIATLRRQNGLERWARQRMMAFPYDSDIAALPQDAVLRVLNIGCGPISELGEASNRPLSLVHMDPLARAHDRLMRFLDAPDRGEVIFGTAEILRKFNLGLFDVIVAPNGLPHAYDAPIGLMHLVDSLETRGVIALTPFENASMAAGRSGTTDWNIEIRGGQIHMWTATRSALFDHQAHGFDLEVSRKSVKSRDCRMQARLDIKLRRGL